MSINIDLFKLHLLGACTIVARLLEHSFIHELWCHIIQYCHLPTDWQFCSYYKRPQYCL